MYVVVEMGWTLGWVFARCIHIDGGCAWFCCCPLAVGGGLVLSFVLLLGFLVSFLGCNLRAFGTFGGEVDALDLGLDPYHETRSG